MSETRISLIEPAGTRWQITVSNDQGMFTISYKTKDFATEARELFKRMVREGCEFHFPPQGAPKA
jgi:hypothetical protein